MRWAHMNTTQAKDFLVGQAGQQAVLDHIPLSDLEKRMMYFTESDPASCDDPIGLHNEFEAEYDSSQYEAKMRRLLHHAYRRLKADNPGERLQWEEAVSTLEKGDHYVLMFLGKTTSTNGQPSGPGNKVIKYGSMFVAGVFLVISLANDHRIPSWAFECLGILLFVLFILTMFFLAQQAYRGLRRGKSD